jgi:hypothetical protein
MAAILKRFDARRESIGEQGELTPKVIRHG